MSTSRFASVRNAFVTGLLLLAPLAVTWLVFSWLVGAVGGRFRDYFFFYVPAELLHNPNLEIVWNVLATVIVVVLVTALGYVSRYVFGRYFGGLAERVIQSIPGVSTVYSTVKQIVETFGSQNRNMFSKVVLVEFPRKGLWSVGFLTSKAQGEPQAKTAEEVWTVFVPTTPNPTTGFLILLPQRDIVELDMSVGEGMKMIISGGAVVPPWNGEDGRPLTVQNPPAAEIEAR
ncbi:MAG TPA: DUF502 domain-containing protein [Opitutaceae bacterium]